MLKSIILIGIFLFSLIFFVVLVVYLYYMKRAKRIENKVQKWELNNNYEFKNFIIKNPYEHNGKYFKAQLHTHTTKSDGKIEITDLIQSYKNRGYNFLAITDHNMITINNDYDNDQFITIPGEELTIRDPFRPLGRHINRLFVENEMSKHNLEDVDEILSGGGINFINHPATISGLGTQRWDIDFLLRLENIRFIEIANHFSVEESNIKYWHILLNKYGYGSSIWSLAVDDAHRKEDIDKNWIMVKTTEISEDALYEALKRGSFYCTQGIKASFNVKNKQIIINTDEKHDIKIINAENEVVKKVHASKLSYDVTGGEGFIRVEIVDKVKNQKLWSQPFWLVKEDEV